MTNYELVKSLLEEQPRGRLRANKNKAIAYLIRKKYQQLFQVDNNLVADIIAEASSLDRAWRQVLQENENLRGQDYSQKDELEEVRQLELGYEPGYKSYPQVS